MAGRRNLLRLGPDRAGAFRIGDQHILRLTPSEGASRPLLRRYKYDDDPVTCSLLFDEELGEAYDSFGIEQTSAPFDTARNVG